MIIASSIIPLRFRIDETYLRHKAVSVSRFAYEQACRDFLAQMERLVPYNHPTAIPYRHLNTTMTALMPTLARPFAGPERQALVVGSDVGRRPTTDQMCHVVQQWGQQWGSQNFKKEITGVGQDAYERFLGHLERPVQSWQDFDAADLFLRLGNGGQIGFSAIPSLLASLLAGRESIIYGNKVRWYLAQDGDYGLAAVSQPFYVEYHERNRFTGLFELKKGTFAYKLEFRIQTQVGCSLPWIHLYVRCSRYVDRPLIRKNWQRDVSVKLCMDQARITGWNCSPTLVTLPVSGSHTKPRWDDNLVPLLAAMKAHHLIEPAEIFQEPVKYRRPTPQSPHDQYLVLYAEGFKPGHQVKTGFDFAEIYEVGRSVSELLGLELSTGQSLPVDPSGSFPNLKKLPLSMYNQDEFRRKIFISSRDIPQKTLEDEGKQQVKDEANWQDRLEHQRIALSALRRAAQGQHIFFYLFWSNTFTVKQLQQELYRTLFYEKGDPWPEDMTVVIPPEPIPNDLLEPLEDSGYNPYQAGRTGKEYYDFKKAWDEQMSRAFAIKTQAWEAYLKRFCGDKSGYGLAFVELPKFEDLSKFEKKKYHPDQNVKGAVRRACNQVGLASQMIYPLSPNPKSGSELLPESQGRLRNAVADLLYRQTGLLYEPPRSLYTQAGLSPALASQLHVIGLYRILRYKPNKVDYALAICLRPDGTYWALLPQQPERWLPLPEAGRIIGERFLHKKPETIVLPKEELARFAGHIFTITKDVPTLVLFEASDWRAYNLFPQFANGKAQRNQLDLRHVKPFERLYDCHDLPHLRLIRLRTVGTSGETPQYVPVVEDGVNQPLVEDEGADDEYSIEKDFTQLTGLVDTQAESPFFHYLSIGRRPQTVAAGQKSKRPQYKLDEGGGIAFKHQTIVELVPFFLQEEDEALAWCHVAHFLRFAPGWDGGNIVLPYPLHLAKALLEDQFCILESNPDTEGK